MPGEMTDFQFTPHRSTRAVTISLDEEFIEEHGISDVDDVIYLMQSGDADELMEELGLIIEEYGKIIREDESFTCYESDNVYHQDYAMDIICRRGSIRQVHEDCDTIICEDDDETYLRSDQDYLSLYYCEYCDAYRMNHDTDDCGSSEEHSDYNYTASESSLKHANMKIKSYHGVDSPTFTNTAGLKYTFGVEIETSYGYIPYNEREELNLAAVDDGSISGKEYVTGVLKGDAGLRMLKKICTTINESDIGIDSKCGIHVHIGGAVFSRRFTIIATHLGLMLQNEIFHMLPPSRRDNRYCKMIPSKYSNMNFHNYREHLGELIYDREFVDRNYNKKSDLGRYPNKRYTWLNMVGYSQAQRHNTIEFRPHSGSTNYNKIRNWVLICMAFVHFVENHQRRVWEARTSVKGITLDEVLRTSLGDNLGSQLSKYVESRKKEFESEHLRLDRNSLIPGNHIVNDDNIKNVGVLPNEEIRESSNQNELS